MTYLIDRYGGKTTILAGLLLQALQLLLLGFFQRAWMMWVAGIIASLSSITYPAISAYMSSYADADKQGLVQGLITGVRSLCGGIGPAMFGLLFNIFDVDMYEEIRANPFSPNTAQDPLKPFIAPDLIDSSSVVPDTHQHLLPSMNKQASMSNTGSSISMNINNGNPSLSANWIVGPPFLFGAILVLLAAISATFIPDTIMPFRRAAGKPASHSSHYRYTTVSSSGNFENVYPNLANSSGSNREGLNSSNCELLEDMDD